MSRSRLSLLALSDGCALTVLRPGWSTWPHRLEHPRQWFATEGSDHAVAQAASTMLWLAALWLALAIAMIACSQLPGRAGAAAAAMSNVTVPATLKRALAGTAAAAAVLGPLPTAWAAPAPPPPPTTPAQTAIAAMPWPGDTAAPSGSRTAPLAAMAAPPTSERPAQPVLSGVRTQGVRPTAPTAPTAPPPSPTRPTDAATVTVTPGESLWSIAAAHLGADATAQQIAEAWPRLYQANRAAIGNDPDLIVTGTHLVLPDPEDIP